MLVTELAEGQIPTFRKVELTQVSQLADLKPVAQTYITEVGRWRHDWPAQPATYEQSQQEEQILAKSNELGRNIWESNGKDRVPLKDNIKPLAGIYLALLGKAQELTPEEAKRVTNAWELQTQEGKDFMNIARRYDRLIVGASNPGVLGRLTGRKGISHDEVTEMETKVWQAFQIEELPPQTPLPSPAA